MKRLPHNKNKTTVHEANLKGVRHKVQRRQGEKKDEDILIVNTFWKRKNAIMQISCWRRYKGNKSDHSED